MDIFCTSLVDTRTTECCQPEFGLSLLIEAYGKRFLLDTGQGKTLQANASALGVDLSSLDAVVLSHGHYDHTGGLDALAPQCPVYAVKGVSAPCFSRRDDGVQHWISMPEEASRFLKKSDLRIIDDFTELFPGIFVTGPIPRTSGEDCGGHFFTDDTCTTPHAVPEEQSILLQDGILITGCCHAGVINTVEACRRARPDIPIRAIIGGLHLLHAGQKRLEQTAEYLSRLPLEQVVLMHCTGDEAGEFLQSRLKCRVYWGKAGQRETLLQPDTKK